MAKNADNKIPGTSITESSMERMLRHNRELTGQPTGDPPIDHAKIAENLAAAQPVLLPGIGAPRINATRVTKAIKIAEGVGGTSPTPGQDNIAYVPPTTSNTADPNNPGKGPDAENEPATKTTAQERIQQDLNILFAENFGKDDDEEESDKDGEGEEGDDKSDKDKDKKGDKEKDKDDESEGEEAPMEEAVQVHCQECGYDETYVLSESNLTDGTVPVTPDGKLDNKCPMCGTNMDLSMIGATNQGEISDPNPRTDARGNSGQAESTVPRESIAFANSLMTRVVEGEDPDALASEVIASDFMKREPALV